MQGRRSRAPAPSARTSLSRRRTTSRVCARCSRPTIRPPLDHPLEISMNDSSAYTPPKVWTWNKPNGGQFASINRPIAGSTHEKELPVGKHPFQLYSLATPNGQKVTIMFEELLAAGHKGAEYDAWPVKIGDGEQFGSGFVADNPHSKIPALMDR